MILYLCSYVSMYTVGRVPTVFLPMLESVVIFTVMVLNVVSANVHIMTVKAVYEQLILPDLQWLQVMMTM